MKADIAVDPFLDTFKETGSGAAERSDVTNNEKVGTGTIDYIPANLPLFGQVGGGIPY